jgi:hypothetical protein
MRCFGIAVTAARHPARPRGARRLVAEENRRRGLPQTRGPRAGCARVGASANLRSLRRPHSSDRCALPGLRPSARTDCGPCVSAMPGNGTENRQSLLCGLRDVGVPIDGLRRRGPIQRCWSRVDPPFQIPEEGVSRARSRARIGGRGNAARGRGLGAGAPAGPDRARATASAPTSIARLQPSCTDRSITGTRIRDPL